MQTHLVTLLLLLLQLYSMPIRAAVVALDIMGAERNRKLALLLVVMVVVVVVVLLLLL